MRRSTSHFLEGVLCRGILLVLVAELATGCTTGRLSPSAIVGPDDIEKRLVGAKAFEQAGNCFHYGDREKGLDEKENPSLLPGDRLRIEIWSAGTQDYDYKNAFPPLVRTIDLPIRIVKDRPLDAAEEQVLATFLQVNRSPAWNQEASNQGEGITRSDRQKLAAALKRHEADIWNAFARSLCVKAIAPGYPDHPDPEASPVLVVQASIRDLCRALPDTEDQQRFARAFLVASNADIEYRKGCSANPISREPMTVVGLRGDAALGNWASTALAANAVDGDDYYAQDLALASPKAVQGTIEFESVAPFRAAPPTWSLKEWEEAEICVGSARAPLKIMAVRLRGSNHAFRIAEGTDDRATHEVKVENGRRELITSRRYSQDWSLPLKALSRLTVADVDELTWGYARKVEALPPPGCVMKGRD